MKRLQLPQSRSQSRIKGEGTFNRRAAAFGPRLRGRGLRRDQARYAKWLLQPVTPHRGAPRPGYSLRAVRRKESLRQAQVPDVVNSVIAPNLIHLRDKRILDYVMRRRKDRPARRRANSPRSGGVVVLKTCKRSIDVYKRRLSPLLLCQDKTFRYYL